MIDSYTKTKYFASFKIKAPKDLVINLQPAVNELYNAMRNALVDIDDINIYIDSIKHLIWAIEGDHTEYHGTASYQHEMILKFLKEGGMPAGWELV